MRFQGQVKFLDVFDGFQRNGAFYRLPDARVNVFERVLLFRQLLFHGTVVNGTKYAHAVSEQAGTNEEENGSEGDPQNTGTPDAGGAEDSKADAPESGEDENAGNNADAAVSAVQTMIDALPIVSELDGMTADELDAAYDDIQAAYDAYEALNAEQQAQITGADFEALLGWFNSQTALLADAQSGEHTHCVCGKDSGTTVIPITTAQHGRQPIPCLILRAAII